MSISGMGAQNNRTNHYKRTRRYRSGDIKAVYRVTDLIANWEQVDPPLAFLFCELRGRSGGRVGSDLGDALILTVDFGRVFG